MVCKGNNSFVVACNCGCDNSMIVKVIDDVVFISFASSDFSIKQNGIDYFIDKIKQKIEEIYCIKNHKKFYLSGVIVNVEEKDLFLEAINSIKVNDGATKISNSAIFEIDKEDEALGFFCLNLINKTPLKESLKGRTYRAYDIAMNKQQWDGFVKYSNNKLKD